MLLQPRGQKSKNHESSLGGTFLGQAWAEGKGELATCRHRADSGQETDCT